MIFYSWYVLTVSLFAPAYGVQTGGQFVLDDKSLTVDIYSLLYILSAICIDIVTSRMTNKITKDVIVFLNIFIIFCFTFFIFSFHSFSHEHEQLQFIDNGSVDLILYSTRNAEVFHHNVFGS